MAVTPSSSARYFTQLYGTQHGAPSFGYIWDAAVEWNDTQGLLHTGAMRPITPQDFANVTISGLSFTGQLSIDDSIGITGGYLGITGTANVNSVISNALLSGISGQLAGSINVTGVTNSGNYGFQNSAITGSQTQVPVGAWSWSVYVESGVGFVNGVPYNTFETIAGGGYDGQKRLSTAINVGCTGTAANPSRVLISWES